MWSAARPLFSLLTTSSIMRTKAIQTNRSDVRIADSLDAPTEVMTAVLVGAAAAGDARCTLWFALSAARTPKSRSVPQVTDPCIAATASADSAPVAQVATRL